MAERDPYIAIMVAAHTGKGLRLTADETWHLAHDDAIETRAGNSLEKDEFGLSWPRIDPKRERRNPANLADDKARKAKQRQRWADDHKQPYRDHIGKFDGHWSETREHIGGMRGSQ